MFDQQAYVNRRARLRKEVGDGVLLFLGNALVGMNYHDNEYPFRQDSTFLYFFGLDQAGLAAVIDIDAGEEVVFGGLRNELDYLITPDGCRVLGTLKKPMTLDEVYAARM